VTELGAEAPGSRTDPLYQAVLADAISPRS
jgi:hypothetical protein